ncbi:Zinc finger, PMZ-type [Sesbania bispinosa]|nr:Zinc finger, PMZ-type [Sesbania bispinosa]
MEDRVREPRAEARCGCRARFQIHVDKKTGRWYCNLFDDEHNHDLLGIVHCSMLPAHRKMSDSDVIQMNNMIKVGIRPPNIFSTFASQLGGYEKIVFRKKGMYNNMTKQRWKLCSDAKAVVEYLGELSLRDGLMYFEHTVDSDGRLEHLFWTDGMSQVDYKLYGDNARFTKGFEDCMLRYYDVGTFRKKWHELVSKFGLQENQWVNALYEKRTMWATTHSQGKFFAGFGTTSRCEGLHSELVKFVNSRYNLRDFLQHFQCCLSHMRFKEKEDDFTSVHGDPVMQTDLQAIERSTARIYTRKVFFIFRRVLYKASMLVVRGYTQAVRCTIFTVSGQGDRSYECRVSFYVSSNNFKCGCLKMESRGLPCEHIIAVMAHVGMNELPDSLSARRASLVGFYYDISAFKAKTIDKYNVEREKLVAELRECHEENVGEQGGASAANDVGNGNLKNPQLVATKGSGVTSSSSGLRVRRKQICSICKLPGHNKLTCPRRADQGVGRQHGTSDAGPSEGVSRNYPYEEFDAGSWAFD